ncbi:uncharacterized protein LOC126757351 [Bactrocera neohumeralis]|uniref:uncharacterized protein LOC126757351 n=1 Tax=Bactrocera neohumeralis TaxID=98809 RepID=UPI002165635B|nr:uncharacterized protein LOC126757351 [Bactrocera neohumeralis]
MGGSRSYSVSSTSSVASSTSGNYSEYSAAGSEERCKATKLVYSRIASQRRATATGAAGTGGGVGVMAPQTNPQQQQPKVQRARSQRIMCRCCLSEQQPATRQSLGSCSEQELDEEEAAHLEFVPLDTLAMVDLSDDRFAATSSAATGDSYKPALSRTSPAKGNKVNSMSTTSPANNNSRTGSSSTSGGSSSTTGSISSTLLDCLNACAQIGASLADNELPQHICLDCCHTLEMCCEFIRCVRNADKILRRRCALPVKRVRQQQQQHYWQQRQAAGMPAVSAAVYGEEGPAAKRRRRREEKVSQEHRLSIARADVSAKSLGNNTPKSISLPKSLATPASAALSVTSTPKSSSAERDELLDISKALDGVESSFVRSFDSGIEVDEDLCSVKSSDCSANEYPLRCHLAKYEGYTYVVAETLSHDLERFHRSGRPQASAGGGAAAAAVAATTPATYKCGFCIFECSVRQELNKHLQMHLGPPQHSCRKCNFVGHFKFLLAQHMRNVHHCALEGQEVNQKCAERGGGDIARGYQGVGVGAAAESPKYHCHLCAECFVNYDGLQQHRKSHKVFCKCTMCTFKSSTRENVLEHMAKVHKVLVERRLSVKYIPLQRINAQHMQELTPTKNVSVATETKFIPKDNKYRKHLCQFCGKCFDRRFHLLKHEYGVHRIEIEQTNSDVDVVIRTKLPSYGAGGNSSKHTKLKYLRQRNAVQAARQQRYIEDLALLDEQQPGQDISNKFQCEICMAVFMFNFELKYHMRTHKTSTHTQTTVGRDLADKRTATPPPTLSTAAVAAAAAVIVQPEPKLINATVKECAEITVENREAADNGECDAESDDDVEVEGDGEGDGDGDADDETLKFTPDISHNIDATLTGLSDGVDLDLMALVAPQMSPLDSLDASPASSNNSFDINYDDQLYLNDFDLGLLDCSGVFAGF